MLPASEIDATVCSPVSSPGESRIATARWRGIWLRDVLHGLDEGVSVTSADGKTVDLSGAMANTAFLAYAMSGVRLDAKHGAPLKLIVPGYDDRFMPGWVRRISVRDSTLSTFAIPQNAHAQAIILPPQQVYLGQTLSLQGYAYAGNVKIDQVCLSIHRDDRMPITFIQGEPGVWSRWGCVWQPTQLGIAQLTIEVIAGSQAASVSRIFQVHPIT
jgi:DMSO/TMAO reductase YedYZ molybdopterin-dependent catalytic subunit